MLALLVLAATTSIVAVLCAQKVHASSLDWVNSPTLTIKKEGGDIVAAPNSQKANIDCSGQRVITRPEKRPPAVLVSQTEQNQMICGIRADYGLYGGGLLQRTETGVAGPLYDHLGFLQQLMAEPGLKTGVFLERGAPTGSYVSLVSNLDSYIESKRNIDYSVRHTLKSSTPKKWLHQTNGQPLDLRSESISFSGDGAWLIADSPFVGQVRVDMETGQVFTFGQNFSYNNGQSPNVKTAISSSGRFALVYSWTYGFARVYDLENCPTKVGLVNQCSSKNLWSKITEATSNERIANMRFVTDEFVRMYSGRLSNGETLYQELQLTPTSDSTKRLDYLALGDSFAAGEGAFDYKDGTDTDSNKCHLSRQAYPFLLKTKMIANSVESVACSGAVIEDVTSKNDSYAGQESTKKEFSDYSETELASVLETFAVGKISQLQFIDEHKPNVITVSMGGNNLGFGKKTLACVLYDKQTRDTCFDNYEQRRGIIEEAKAQIQPLKEGFGRLKENAGAVYVVGYPKIVKAGGVYCKGNVHLNDEEKEAVDQITEIVNDAVETAAKQAGVFYVDTEDALIGHRLCETPDNKQIAVHGITAGNDRGYKSLKFIGAESYHPTELGQKLYAEAVFDKSYSLRGAMPKADPSATFPERSDNDPFLKKFSAQSSQELYRPKFVDLGIGEILRGSSILLDIKGLALSAGSVFGVELHSTPQSLGQATVNSDGQILSQVTIPSDLKPGYHSIHLYGQNSVGENIELYDYFFVGATNNDLNGNGVTDGQESCLSVGPISVDEDKDGVDDACDGIIGPAPAEELVDVTDPIEPPTITNLGGPDKERGLGESVAGNEPLVVDSQLTSDISSPKPALGTSSTSSRATSLTPDQQSAQALGQSSATSSTVAQPGALTQEKINELVATDVAPKKIKSSHNWLWLLIAAGFLLAVFVGYRVLGTRLARGYASDSSD